MKNKINIYIYMVIALSLFSCEKTVYNKQAHGRVIDETTGLPIAGAWVELDGENSSFLGPTTYTTDGKTYTDKKGEFKFSYRKTRNAYYKVYAGAEDYFFSPFGDYMKVNFDKRNQLEIKLVPKAVLGFDIIRVSNAHYVFFTTMNGRGGGEDNCSENRKGFSYIVQGNYISKIRYTIHHQNGSSSTYDTSVYCPAFQRTRFKIEY